VLPVPDAVFIPGPDGRFEATELARGPWDPGAQHGGAPAALLMAAFEALPAPDGLQIARVTYEFMRPIPLGELDVRAEVVRPGRRVQLLEASVATPDGGELIRARALQVRRADPSATDAPEPPPAAGPDEGHPDSPRNLQHDLRMFGADAMDISVVAGAFREPGPATAWFRLRAPLIAGRENSPLQRIATAADFGNGIGSRLPWGEWLFINADLTVYVERLPIGEWICLQARTLIARDGVGVAEGILYDETGRVGRATQALLIARR
jgi:Thioesterase-like superfamily